jgi:hypothetical protein
VTAVVDMYPKVFRRGYRRELLILALSVVSYFLGLVMLTEVSDTVSVAPGLSGGLWGRGVSHQTPALRLTGCVTLGQSRPFLLHFVLLCMSLYASSG